MCTRMRLSRLPTAANASKGVPNQFNQNFCTILFSNAMSGIGKSLTPCSIGPTSNPILSFGSQVGLASQLGEIG